ncbi:MYXO-CTERM sorting domain-containing protein [Polyangium sorediatum]|uniref:MYXO-CTERM sorting domain-containing protein n=1 Tax=Polyangium sorediatum TaxID=889274 RepID=A0ABT6NJH7_9BACT|nr:MYXO-CTERM sorting domain-containing protein [Polyangium sorediatum]MDI1428443.1 MYXO-CTERM sorting domain-containing protein [Polyangium sorediatum]
MIDSSHAMGYKSRVRIFFSTLLVIALSTFTAIAAADVAGPHNVCDVEGLGCQQCYWNYDRDPGDQPNFDRCAGPLREKGLAEACRHKQGAGDVVFFCPAGVKPETRVVGGGCGGCTTAGAAEGAGMLVFAAGLGIAWTRRRRISKGTGISRDAGRRP